MTDNGPRLIGRKEAAIYCGISPTCLSMWVAGHKMPHGGTSARLTQSLTRSAGWPSKTMPLMNLRKWSQERDARKARGG